MYDIIVIGGGPAGVSAAIYAVSRGMKTLVLERDAIGGTIAKVSAVTHYSGIVEGETGASLAARLQAQAEDAGVEIRFEEALSACLEGDVKTVRTSCGDYEARCLILANGTAPRGLGIPGEHLKCANAAKEGPSCRGRHVYVVGGADGAVKEAVYLSDFASRLTIVYRGEQLGCIAEFKRKIAARGNIDVMLDSALVAIDGQDRIESLLFENTVTGQVNRIDDPGCAVFIYAGALPDTGMYDGLSLEGGYISVDGNMETGIPGVFAAGDVCAKSVRQVATAVSDGAIAGIRAAAYCG